MILTDLDELRKISEPVSNLEEELEIISLLENHLAETSNGIGLAAPQIGILKRVSIVRIGHQKVNLVNSNIILGSGEIVFEEGCLSLPNQSIKVKRNLDILVQNNGFINNEKFSAFGLPAVCVQHEMDHWDGILMIDKAIKEHTETGPNMPCPCGSGKKYKKCCKKGA